MSPEVMEAVKDKLLPLCTLVITRPDDRGFLFPRSSAAKRLTIDGPQGHGHGNLLSSAIAVMLSRGESLAVIDGHIVAARQGRELVTAFHPELDEDLRVHEYFLSLCQS
ncbi:MAG: hypothetical protein K6A28_02265 [Bacteroidales bacterium]|nr:hypothetical protein [Bacteroidales bacterium]